MATDYIRFVIEPAYELTDTGIRVDYWLGANAWAF